MPDNAFAPCSAPDEDAALSERALASVRCVSRNVRRLAAERGIPLAHLADRAGIGRTTMWRLLDVNEQGPSDPRLSTIAALARALDVETAYLLEDDGEG